MAQNLTDGTELLLTDLGSEKIVGHGKVAGEEIVLSVSQEAEGFFLYVVTPSGEVATHHGEVRPDGLLGVFSDTGELLDFADVLEGR
ncbi:MAG: hypothetical protein ACRCYY_07365, partial [Trueperaceae bacterium]